MNHKKEPEVSESLIIVNRTYWITVVAVFGCLANFLIITGIEHVYLAIASLLNNTFPLFVIIVAYFMFKETLNRIQAVAIVLAFIGVILMSINALTKGDDIAEKGLSSQAIGFILIVLSELGGALSYTSIKKLPGIDLVQLTLYKILLILLVSLLYMIGRFAIEGPDAFFTSIAYSIDSTTLSLLFVIALCDLSVNLLIFKTFQMEKAGISASMNFLCLIWSLIIDVTLFNQTFSSTEVIGGLIVLATTTLIVFSSSN